MQRLQPFEVNNRRKNEKLSLSKSEVDILSALRNGEDILPLIKQCVWEKEEALGGQFTSINGKPEVAEIINRSMIHIGG